MGARRVNSRRKGAEGERAFAQALTSFGHPAIRGQQRAGGSDSPDVKCESLPGVHWEVKVYKACQMNSPAMLAEWDAQAIKDAGSRLPVIAHKWARSAWWVRVLSAERGAYWQPLEVALPYLRSL